MEASFHAACLDGSKHPKLQTTKLMALWQLGKSSDPRCNMWSAFLFAHIGKWLCQQSLIHAYTVPSTVPPSKWHITNISVLAHRENVNLQVLYGFLGGREQNQETPPKKLYLLIWILTGSEIQNYWNISLDSYLNTMYPASPRFPGSQIRLGLHYISPVLIEKK